MTELLFIIEEREDGIYNAKAVEADIAAQSTTREGVESSIRQAVREHFHAAPEMPQMIRLHFTHDKTISVVEPTESAPQGNSAAAPPALDWRGLRGTLLRYDDPTEPVGVEDWEALK